MFILADTSLLLAYLAPKDAYHQKSKIFIQETLKAKHTLLVPTSVLGELFYMVTRRVSYTQAGYAFQAVYNNFTLVDLTLEDMRRMHAIMTQYASAEFDYVDSSLMALSERLGLRHIATFDRRDFALFRPRHVDFLELQPA